MQAKRLWWSLTVICLSTLGILVCLVLAAVFSLPWFVSTDWGRAFLVEKINARIPGEVRLESLKLAWLSPCHLTGLTLLDSNEQIIAHVDRLEVSSGLLEILQKTPVEEARLAGGSLRLEVDSKGVSSLERALGLSPSLPCRSPRIDQGGPTSELDHVELEWTARKGTGRLISSALCRQGTVQGSWRVDSALEHASLQRWDVELDQIPTEIFDSLAAALRPSLRGLCRTLVGDQLTLHSNGSSGESLQGSLEIRSPTFEGRWMISGSQQEPMAALVSPAILRVERSALQQLLRSRLGAAAPLVKTDLRLSIPDSTWDSRLGPHLKAHLAAPAEAAIQQHQLRLTDWELSVQREHELWSVQSQLQGSGDTQPWSAEGTLQLAPLRGSLKAAGLPTWLAEILSPPGVSRRLIGGDKLSLECSVGPQYPNPWTLRATVSGASPSAVGLPVVIEGSGQLHERHTSFHFDVSAPRLELRTGGTWTPGQEIALESSSGLLRWNQSFVQGLGFQALPGLGRQMVPVRLSMDPLTIDLCRGGLPILRARLEAAAFELEQLKKPIQIQHFEGKLALHPSDERASLQLTAELHTQGQAKTSIALSGTARELGKVPSFEGRVDCPSLPVGLIEALYPKADGLDEVLGNHLAIQADLISKDGGLSGSLDAQISGSTLQMALPLAWNKGWSLLPAKLATLSIKMSPAQVRAAGRWVPAAQHLQLLQPLSLAAECSFFEWHRSTEPLPALGGVIKLQPLVVELGGRAEPLMIPSCSLSFSQAEKQPLTRGVFQAEVELDQELGRVRADASWDRQAAWNTFSATAELSKIPTALVEMLTGWEGQTVEAAVGSRCQARLSVASQDEGSKNWMLQARTSQLGLSASGWLRRDGTAGLSSPLLMGWTASPALARAHLGELTPVTRALVPGQTIAASVQAEGFRTSWKHPSFDTLSLGRAVVDAGRVTLQQSDFLNEMEDFLKSQDGRKREDLWLTPAYFSVKADKLSLERVDFLVNQKIPVALWGDLSLTDGALAMTLGFPAESLAGFLQTPVGSSGLFTVGLGGTVENPRVDWGGAAARLAVSAASKLNLGTLVIGSLMDRVLTKGVPAPTTQPLPWKAPDRPALKEQLLRELERELAELPPAS